MLNLGFWAGLESTDAKQSTHTREAAAAEDDIYINGHFFIEYTNDLLHGREIWILEMRRTYFD